MICFVRKEMGYMSLKRIFCKKVFKIFAWQSYWNPRGLHSDGLSTLPLTFHYSYPFHCSHVCSLNLMSLPLRTASTLKLSKNDCGKSLALDLVLSHPRDEIILVTAAVAQRIMSHSITYTHHAFIAKLLKA